MPIVCGQQWSLFNKHSTIVTKGANAEKTVRQASSAGSDIVRYAHATERNRNSNGHIAQYTLANERNRNSE